MDGLRSGHGRRTRRARRAALFSFRRSFRSVAFVLTLIAALGCGIFANAAVPSDAPRVVVYSFTTSGDTQPAAGGAIATGIADKLASAGDIAVLPPTPGTARPQFLTSAVAQNADYYITGFVTTIGREVSLIAQLVSTQSGAVVWSNTWLIATLDDATSHAAEIRVALLRRAGRTLGSYDQPVAQAQTPKPVAESSGHIDNLLGALGHRSRKRDRAKATPTPVAVVAAPTAIVATPTAVVATPVVATPSSAPSANIAAAANEGTRSILVLDVGGDAERTARVHATSALVAQFARDGVIATHVNAPSAKVGADAHALCAANPTATGITAATLHVDERLVAEFALTTYDCNGRALTLDTAKGSALGKLGFISVLDGLVARAAEAYLHRSPRVANSASPAGAR